MYVHIEMFNEFGAYSFGKDFHKQGSTKHSISCGIPPTHAAFDIIYSLNSGTSTVEMPSSRGASGMVTHGKQIHYESQNHKENHISN